VPSAPHQPVTDRAAALRSLGFTPKQAAFVATVALHSGVCLRRQYAAFMKTQSGKNASDFLDGLVDRRLAARTRHGTRHGFVYHLFGSVLYRLVGEPDNRNRRAATPAVVARRLMLLDLAIARPDVHWITTEHEKVELFTRLGVPRSALPHRTYDSSTPGAKPTIRYFVQKLPLFLMSAGDAHVTFVCPVSETDGNEVKIFLHDHQRLLRALSSWRLLVVGPRHLANDLAAFEAFSSTVISPPVAPALAAADIQWYRETDAVIREGRIASLSVENIRRFRDLRSRLQTSAAATTDASRPNRTPPTLQTHWLPFSYPA
jgi:hypothetical protein